MKRQDLINELNKFYVQNGITPDEKINCAKKDICGSMNIKLAQGMQCHIGSQFRDRNGINVLVVSLDCGSGGKESIKERTETIEGLINKDIINPHMRGTIACLSDLFQEKGSKESLRYYAMTNSCKCTRNDSTDQLPEFFYHKCADYKLCEIELISPNIIYFQGKNALIGCEFENISHGVCGGIFEFLKYLKIGNKKIYAVQCIHPSARGRNAKMKRIFYDELLPEINEYLRIALKN